LQSVTNELLEIKVTFPVQELFSSNSPTADPLVDRSIGSRKSISIPL